VHGSDVCLQRRQQSNQRAALQIVRNEEVQHKDSTNPLQRRLPQRREVVRAETRRVGQFGGLAVHSDEAPDGAPVGTRHRKRRHSRKIFERLRFAIRDN
jgi:hypothetical protein